MDDPGWSWPAWKFGLKRDDLFTSLHDRYNTFTSTIQDPEAFHHDVFEVSRDASTAEEFHRLMADRQRQRLQELSASLESLAVEIIANPKLMDSEHWQYALQLFRTRSFDSIVRFFASYLPNTNPDRRDTQSTTSSSMSEYSVRTASTTASSVDDAPCSTFLDDDLLHEGSVITHEPEQFDDADIYSVEGDLPRTSSPRPSESDRSEDSAESEPHGFGSRPPSRSMSFSGSEAGPFEAGFLRQTSFKDEDEFSRSDCDTAVTSISDCAESHSSLDSMDKDMPLTPVDEDDEDDFPTAQFPEDDFDHFDYTNDNFESETPTPKQEIISTSYIEYKSVMSRRVANGHRRSPSPKVTVGDRSPLQCVRRSPEELLSKVQKPFGEPMGRRRPKARKGLC